MDDPNYIAFQTKRILKAREKFPLQPILFVGSGLSRRWMDAPDWLGLLRWAVKHCPEIKFDLEYFVQQESDLPKVASRLTNDYQKWAWGKGKNSFPKELFDQGQPKDIYLKHAIASEIKSYDLIDTIGQVEETEAFTAIRPHAVITTNYDKLLEKILPDYTPVLGHGLLRAPFASIGEIYKIHGTVDEPSSLVLTAEDYKSFSEKRRYLTAKMLTFVNEHPILFVGYSVEDKNILQILEDLNEALEIPEDLIPNFFFLSRPNSADPGTERVVQVAPGKGIRVNLIETPDFSWVFKAFGHNAPLANVNPQVLRAILARAYNLVRSDIPKQKVEVNFEMISQHLESSDEFAKMFGIATLQPATEFSAQYPYTLTELGVKLGYPMWHGAHKLLQTVRDETGVDLKESDNLYHCTVKTGPNSQTQKYSEIAYQLPVKVRDGVGYELVELNSPGGGEDD